MSATKKSRLEHLEAPEVVKFVDYLKIRTVHPTPAYRECRLWLLEYLAEIGLEVEIILFIDMLLCNIYFHTDPLNAFP